MTNKNKWPLEVKSVLLLCADTVVREEEGRAELFDQ